MANQETKKIFEKFNKNINIGYGFFFVAIVCVMGLSTYLLKTELADQVTRTVEGKIKSGDTREIVNILSDAGTHDFLAVDLYDRNAVLELTFPTRFRRNVSPSTYLWRRVTQMTYQKQIFFDLNNKSVAATIVFTFGIFQLLPMAIIVFVGVVLLTYPLVRRYKNLLAENLEKDKIEGQMEALSELARQVRHDYKSPLMAIKSVIDKTKSLSSLETKTLSVAYNKMMSMLSDLSQENIKDVLEFNPQTEKKEKVLTHIYSSVLSVVEEKMSRQFSEQDRDSAPKVMIKIICSDDNKRIHAPIEDIELQRVVSNLLENAIESIQSGKGGGEVLFRIQLEGTLLRIEIEDNGKGVPENILHKIGEKGFSYGKRNGEGLGLYSAIRKIQAWSGNLCLDSTESVGTQVKIEIPGAVKPQWASSQVDLEGIERVVVLDDDPSIHQIWDEKLRGQITKVYKFTSARKLMERMGQFGNKTLFLLDYELRGQRETGLDVAKELGAEHPCYLVTNSFQNSRLQRECKKLGVALLPKTIMQ